MYGGAPPEGQKRPRSKVVLRKGKGGTKAHPRNCGHGRVSAGTGAARSLRGRSGSRLRAPGGALAPAVDGRRRSRRDRAGHRRVLRCESARGRRIVVDFDSLPGPRQRGPWQRRPAGDSRHAAVDRRIDTHRGHVRPRPEQRRRRGGQHDHGGQQRLYEVLQGRQRLDERRQGRGPRDGDGDARGNQLIDCGPHHRHRKHERSRRARRRRWWSALRQREPLGRRGRQRIHGAEQPQRWDPSRPQQLRQRNGEEHLR